MLQALGERVEVISGIREILADVFLLTEIKAQHPVPEGNKYLLEKLATGMHRDPFNHELIMVIKESDGLTLFTGCGHRGIVNMVETVQESFPRERIKAVVV